jgi:hypothetical protein
MARLLSAIKEGQGTRPAQDRPKSGPIGQTTMAEASLPIMVL